MKKAIFMTAAALSLTALMLLAQDASKFAGKWRAESGQTRELTVKDGSIFMTETFTDRPDFVIHRQYPFNGKEITMGDDFGVWAGSKATGHMEGNKLVVDTEMATGTKWHDEWTMAADGNSFAALRLQVGGPPLGGGGKGKGPGGGGAAKGPGGGAPGGGKGPGGGGAAKGKGGPAEPEVYTRIQ